MKTKEELSAIREEIGRLRGKLGELSEEELAEVTGGGWYPNGWQDPFGREPRADVQALWDNPEVPDYAKETLGHYQMLLLMMPNGDPRVEEELNDYVRRLNEKYGS